MAKTALLLQLIRIFTPNKSGLVYWVTQALIWGNFAFNTSVLFSVIFQCIPQKKIWDPLSKGGHCVNIEATILFSGIFNVISNILILILLIWATYHLRMAPKQKARISAIFATGLMCEFSQMLSVAVH